MVSAREVKPGMLPLPLVLVLIWIGGLPLFRLLPIHLGGVPGLTPERVAFAAALLAWAVEALRSRRRLLAPGAIELALGIYLAAFAASWLATWPAKDAATLKQDADFLLACAIMPAAAFVVARNMPWTPTRITASLWVLVAGVGTLLAAWGLTQSLYDWGFLLPPALKEMHPDRAQGPFDNAVPYGVTLSLLLPLALVLLARTPRRAARLALAVLLLGLLQGIVASKTRSVWLALPVALALTAGSASWRRIVVGALVALLAAQVLLVPQLGFDRWGLWERLTQTRQLDDRVALAATSATMIRARPLWGFGVGVLTFHREKAPYYSGWGRVPAEDAVYPNNPHNDVLNVLVMLGIPGLVVWLAVVVAAWRLLATRRRSADARTAELAAGVQAMGLVLLINGQFHSVLHMSFALVLLWFCIGMLAAAPLSAAPQAVPAPALVAGGAAVRGTR